MDPAILLRTLGIPEVVGLKVGWAVKLTVRTCHNGQKRIFQPDQPPEPNPTLVNALVNAHQWYRALVQDQVDSIEQLSRETGRDARYVKRMLSMVYIAPDIKHAILEGS
ncbi:MAG: hypothetical protein O7C39_05495, partial [Bacteroidetes bacterium]|nr:hypothetical protein [Bacteroidota bacterium]